MKPFDAAWFCAAVLFACAGCATHRSVSLPMPMPGMAEPQFNLPPPAPVRMQVKVPAPIFPWLELGDFFPPHCLAMVPRMYRTPLYVDTPRAWFPSEAECTALQGERTLYHLADSAGTGMDYIVFVRYNPGSRFRALFQVRNALEVLWSPDGSRAAVTVLTGNNNADVVILRMDDLKPSSPIETAPALRGYFNAYQIGAPQFVMALRWTAKGELVLRARGKEPHAPYALFGYEVLVDTDHLIDPGAVTFLRGYKNAPNPEFKPAVGSSPKSPRTDS